MRENDIVFLNLHRRYVDEAPSYGGFIGVFSLAAFLNDNGYLAQGHAGTLQEGRDLLDKACNENKVQMIGLYTDYANVTENIYLSRYIKEKYNLPVIVGGPQATALGMDFFCKSKCDAIVLHEGELTVLELANYYFDGFGKLAEIKGIVYLDDTGSIQVTPERELIENLDALPFIDDACYLTGNPHPDELSIMTGRGCPFQCAFCYEGHHTKKVRFRSVENVLKEIDTFLVKQKKDKSCCILFTDDTFTLKEDRVRMIAEALKEKQKKWSLEWFCEAHIHTLYQQPQMIDYIAAGGARRVQLGIEAGTQEVLDAYQKHSTLNEIRYVVARCRDTGIKQVYSNIILGGAHYSRDVFRKNVTFAKELLTLGQGVVEIGVVSYWPLPETPMTEHPEKYGLIIIDKEFLTSVDDFPQIKTMELSEWEILEMIQQMENELFEHKINMLKNREVPTERILSWFSRSSFRKYGYWWQVLMQNEVLYHYYHCLSTGEVITSADIFDFEHVRPMRVLTLKSNLHRKAEGKAEIADVLLEGPALKTLILSTGRMDFCEILECLKKEYDLTKENLQKILLELEEKHLILFSKE